MKKTLLFSLAAILMAASGAFAVTDITTSTTLGGGTYSPSAKVGIKIISAATSYAATAAHLSGTFEYGTVGGSGVTGDPTKIVKKAYTTTTGTVGSPTAPASATALADGYTD